MNLLLYRILNERNEYVIMVLFCSYILTEHMFLIYVGITEAILTNIKTYVSLKNTIFKHNL